MGEVLPISTKLLKKTSVLKAHEQCVHCGLPCTTTICEGDLAFCCEGCRNVYLLLQESLVCTPAEGRVFAPKTKTVDTTPFRYLNNPNQLAKLVDYQDDKLVVVTLSLPAIHCPSCIWLIEQLPRLDLGVFSARVDYVAKKAQIRYNPSNTSIERICANLAALGYTPQLQLDATESKKPKKTNQKLLIKLGLAGFAFGNIMLFSLPEYLDNDLDPQFTLLFTTLNIILSLPVLFYSASEFFQSAYTALKNFSVNMDVPISLGIIAMFARSIWEISTGAGPGYMDTFNGLIFLLLIGRWFGHRTHEAISFERDYRSFFPLAATRISSIQSEPLSEEQVPVQYLQKDDVVLLRHGELLPADATVESTTTLLDYSFVTGESDPVTCKQGDKALAGGRVMGHATTFRLSSTISQSKLIRLWGQSAFTKEQPFNLASLAVRLSPWFTFIILAIAASTALYWSAIDPWMAFNAVTGVLIIACPCALAMAAPFSLGNALNVLSQNGLYLKTAGVIEKFAGIKNIVFDKTGTLTDLHEYNIKATSLELSANEHHRLYSLFRQSIHPLSQALAGHLKTAPALPVSGFAEVTGMGITANIEGQHWAAGSLAYLRSQGVQPFSIMPLNEGSTVAIARDGIMIGYFTLQARIRGGMALALQKLAAKFHLFLLSGDNEREKTRLGSIFPDSGKMFFNQSPDDKLQKILYIKKQGATIMVGDGLNDAGALKAADIGLAVAENTAAFTPACDGIIESATLRQLPTFIQYSKDTRRVIKINFGISFLYNGFGLFFAVQGLVSPLFCAILMPISSLTVIISGTLLTRFFAWHRGLLQ